MKRVISLFLAALMLASVALSITSCDNGNNPIITDPITTTEADESTVIITDPATTPATEDTSAPSTDTADIATSEPVTEPVGSDVIIGFTNPLTGLPTETDVSLLRPISVSIDNVLKAQPTIGLSLADVVIELPAEGFETRMLAVFLEYQNLPTIGNVRSIRDYGVKFAADFDSIVFHAGSDTDANWLQLAGNAINYGFKVSYLIKKGEIKTASEREDLWVDEVDNVDSLNYYPTPMFRDLDRMYNMSTEHSLMLNAEVVLSSINYRSYRTTLNDGFTYPYTIGTNASAPEDGVAKTIQLPYNPYQTQSKVSYTYDEATGLYKRSNFDDKPSIDGLNNEQLAFKNVIILEVSTTIFPNDSKNRLNVDYVGEGSGYYCANGKYESITWKRPEADSELVICGSDGSVLDIVPGKVIINVYPAEYHDSIVVK